MALAYRATGKGPSYRDRMSDQPAVRGPKWPVCTRHVPNTVHPGRGRFHLAKPSAHLAPVGAIGAPNGNSLPASGDITGAPNATVSALLWRGQNVAFGGGRAMLVAAPWTVAPR
jgi:hypothetical protein